MASKAKNFYKRAHILLILLIFLTFSVIFYIFQLPEKAGTAIARTTSTTCSNAGATTISCTLTSPTNGNTLIASIGTRGTTADRVSSITQTGATWQRATQSTNANGVTVDIWYANNISGAGTSITINLADSVKASAVVAQYSGVLTSSILDKTASSTGNNSSPSTGTTTTTSQSNQLWIGGMANIDSGGTYSAQTNSFTEVGEAQSTTGNANTRNNTVLFEKFVTATGTADVSATLSLTAQWAGAIATFNATGPPTQIAIVMSPTTITAGVCTNAMTLETRDSGGAPVNAANGVVIQLSIVTSVSSPLFYTTSNCSGSSVTSFTFNGSESSKTFYMKDTKALVNAQVLATKISGSDTLSDYTLTYTVTAASMTKLGVRLPGQDINGYSNGQALGTPSNQTAGSSFTITEIVALDAFDNIVPSYSGSKTLSYSGPSNAPNSTAPSYTTTVNFTNGVSTTTLTTTLYNAQTTTITATEGGLYGAATPNLVVEAGALSKYEVFSGAGFKVGQCSTTGGGSSTITAQDQWDNTRTQDTSSVNLTANLAVNFFTDLSCTTSGSQKSLASGQGSFSFIPLRATSAFVTESSGLIITATKVGDTIFGSDGFSDYVSPGTISTILVKLPGQSFTDGSGISGSVNFTGLRTPNATAGTSFTVTLHAVDAYNNLLEWGTDEYTGSKTISWANSAAGGTPAYPVTSVTFSGGSSTTTLNATYYLATTGRNIRADASSPSVTGTASTSFTVQPTLATNYNVTATAVQTAGIAFNVSVTARDPYGNNLGILYNAPSGTYTFTTTANNAPSGTTPTISTLSQGDFSFGVATKSVTLYKAESGVTFTASEPSPSGVTGTSSTVVVNVGTLANYGVSASTPITAGTCSVSSNTITARDTWLNTVTSDTSLVNMTTTGTGVTFYTNSGCGTSTTQYTLSSGTASFFYRTNKKQSMTITATKNADTPTGTSSSIVINPAATSTLLVKLPGQSFTDGSGISGSVNFTGLRTPNATAGTSFTVTLHAVDAYNNLVDSGPSNYTGAKTISWANSTAGNAPNGTVPSYPATSVTFSNGASSTALTAIYYNATTGRTIRADDTGGSINGTVSTTFVVQANAVNNYATSASTPQVAGVAFNVTITARDVYNNALGSLYSAPSGTYIWSTTATSAPDSTAPNIGTLAQGNFSSGVATKSVTLYKAESGVTFTASEPSPSSVTGTSSTVVVNPGNVSANTLDSTITGTSTAFVRDPITVTITLKDTWRNPIPDVNKANFSVTSTGSPNITQSLSNTDSNGQATAVLDWLNAGTYTVSVSINGIILVQNDGSTADTDGLLDSTLSVTVTVPPPSTIMQGGTRILGGTRIQ